jgi:hypothetical protein
LRTFEGFRAGGQSRRTIDDLLGACERERVPVVFVLMPEGSAFRQAYSAAMESQMGSLLEEFARRRGVAVVDAREWIGDDGFTDPRHLAPWGAAAFSRRLREVLAHTLAERKDFTAPTLAAKGR